MAVSVIPTQNVLQAIVIPPPVLVHLPVQAQPQMEFMRTDASVVVMMTAPHNSVHHKPACLLAHRHRQVVIMKMVVSVPQTKNAFLICV